MTPHADPGEAAVLDALYVRARRENALGLFFLVLAVPFFLTLVMHDTIYIGPRSMAVFLGVIMLLIPALSAKGWAAERPGPLTALTCVGVTAGAFVGSAKLWVAALGALCAIAACGLFYRLRNTTNWQPRLMPAAVEKARIAAGLPKSEGN